MRIIISFLVIVALAASAYGQGVARPVPKTITALSDADYAIWAQWQNRQTDRRVAEVSANSTIPRHNYADRVTSSGYTRGILIPPRDYLPTFRYGESRGETMTASKVRYPNPDYIGPGVITHYNPWVRPGEGKGTPAWDTIFVPCRVGTITMQEVLDILGGPADPEVICRIMFEGHFGIERQASE